MVGVAGQGDHDGVVAAAADQRLKGGDLELHQRGPERVVVLTEPDQPGQVQLSSTGRGDHVVGFADHEPVFGRGVEIHGELAAFIGGLPFDQGEA